MEPTSDIVEKIRKCFTLAEGASTPGEREAAMAQAGKLMAKYNIDKITVESAALAYDRKNRPFQIKEEEFPVGRQRYETDQYIARIVRNCYHVKTLWSSDYERTPTFRVVDGKRVPKTYRNGEPQITLKKRLVYYLVGDVNDIEVAKAVIPELNSIMRKLLNAHLRERKLPWNAETCHSYFDGLETEYIAANKRGETEALAESSNPNAVSRYAIVQADKLEAAEEYIEANIPTVRARTMSGPRSGGHDADAYGAGAKAGKSLKIGLKRLK